MPAVPTGASTAHMQSIGNQIGTKMRTLAHHGRPIVEIELDKTHGAQGTWITSYSTMDTIEGTVFVTAPHDTPFQDVEIAFVGECRACKST